MNDRSATFRIPGISTSLCGATYQKAKAYGSQHTFKLPVDEAIRIADYGNSNAGMLKKRYREGLANRYGKRMSYLWYSTIFLTEAFWTALYDHQQRRWKRQ